MKTLISILTLAAFLQTTIIPIDLALIILICRSYTKISKSNLYLALFFGLLISHLNLETLGFESIVFLICVQITASLSKLRLAGNSLMIIPVSFTLLSFFHIASSLIVHQSLDFFPKVLFESLISLPVLYLVRLWEERFIFRKEIKLRV